MTKNTNPTNPSNPSKEPNKDQSQERGQGSKPGQPAKPGQGTQPGQGSDTEQRQSGGTREGRDAPRADPSRAQGDTSGRAGPGTPRYDDRPDRQRGTSGDIDKPGSALPNPKTPSYGDTEPGDPRHLDVEAGRGSQTGSGTQKGSGTQGTGNKGGSQGDTSKGSGTQGDSSKGGDRSNRP